MNTIYIDDPIIRGNTIEYSYKVTGQWQEAFNTEYEFTIEYSCNLSGTTHSIAIIPFLANILPMSWIYDAEIIAPCCDKDFYNSIQDFKQGYQDMYPMITFGGKLSITSIEENSLESQEGTAAFFSGGVDAFNTLTLHSNERPTLITLWGADVKLNDEVGWGRVIHHLKQTSETFNTDYVTIKSGFRGFLNEDTLSRKVAISGDGWWHGFQHGLGIICHAAPVMYSLGRKTVYIASSFTAADKGKVTCASDPTIDNHVRFCGCNVIHDGYEYTRQMKVHNITQFSKKTGKDISLRVCWESTGGSNCCNCEKCWRTILAIYAEGFDPKDFGFEYDSVKLLHLSNRIRYNGDKMYEPLRAIQRYAPIQNTMRENIQKEELPVEIRWFYSADVNRLCEIPLFIVVYRRVRSIASRIKSKIMR